MAEQPAVSASSPKVYIHELIEIIGHNRARYQHHMTANWCPIAREERQQLCFGVWSTVGSTGRWPEVVNMWELDGWGGLVRNFEHELGGGRDQDPSLAQWWAVAASLRRGGFDRILVAHDANRSIEQLCADGVRGEVYAHELVTVPIGTAATFVEAVADEGRTAMEPFGEQVGAWQVAGVNGSEAVVVWALPSWQAWADLEASWLAGDGPIAGWRKRTLDLGADFRRTAMVDSELAPLRTGRQPQVADRRPLDQV
jgi:hypothetical protein